MWWKLIIWWNRQRSHISQRALMKLLERPQQIVFVGSQLCRSNNSRFDDRWSLEWRYNAIVLTQLTSTRGRWRLRKHCSCQKNYESIFGETLAAHKPKANNKEKSNHKQKFSTFLLLFSVVSWFCAMRRLPTSRRFTTYHSRHKWSVTYHASIHISVNRCWQQRWRRMDFIFIFELDRHLRLIKRLAETLALMGSCGWWR